MTDQQQARMAKLAQQALEQADKINDAVQAVEDFLVQASIGTKAAVRFQVPAADGGGTDDCYVLAFHRHKGVWRIVIGDLRDRAESDFDAWAFNEAPRALRVIAYSVLPGLVDLLTCKLSEEVAQGERVLAGKNPNPINFNREGR